MTQHDFQDNELAYWEQRLGKDVPLTAVGYRGLSNAFNSWSYRVRSHRFSNIVGPLARTDMRVLDVGSGGGFYVALWKKFGVKDIVATDMTHASIQAVHRRFPQIETARFDVGAEGIPFPAESFDAISCMDVVHHIMDDGAYQRAFENCARLLRSGGFLVFTDNFLRGPTYRGSHHVSRSSIQIEQVLRTAGLQVIRRAPLFVLMNNPIDSQNSLLKFYWKAMNFVLRNGAVGAVAGMLLYPLELLLTSVLKEGPSTKIVVALKR